MGDDAVRSESHGLPQGSRRPGPDLIVSARDVIVSHTESAVSDREAMHSDADLMVFAADLVVAGANRAGSGREVVRLVPETAVSSAGSMLFEPAGGERPHENAGETPALPGGGSAGKVRGAPSRQTGLTLAPP